MDLTRTCYIYGGSSYVDKKTLKQYVKEQTAEPFKVKLKIQEKPPKTFAIVRFNDGKAATSFLCNGLKKHNLKTGPCSKVFTSVSVTVEEWIMCIYKMFKDIAGRYKVEVKRTESGDLTIDGSVHDISNIEKTTIQTLTEIMTGDQDIGDVTILQNLVWVKGFPAGTTLKDIKDYLKMKGTGPIKIFTEYKEYGVIALYSTKTDADAFLSRKKLTWKSRTQRITTKPCSQIFTYASATGEEWLNADPSGISDLAKEAGIPADHLPHFSGRFGEIENLEASIKKTYIDEPMGNGRTSVPTVSSTAEMSMPLTTSEATREKQRKTEDLREKDPPNSKIDEDENSYENIPSGTKEDKEEKATEKNQIPPLTDPSPSNKSVDDHPTVAVFNKSTQTDCSEKESSLNKDKVYNNMTTETSDGEVQTNPHYTGDDVASASDASGKPSMKSVNDIQEELEIDDGIFTHLMKTRSNDIKRIERNNWVEIIKTSSTRCVIKPDAVMLDYSNPREAKEKLNILYNELVQTVDVIDVTDLEVITIEAFRHIIKSVSNEQPKVYIKIYLDIDNFKLFLYGDKEHVRSVKKELLSYMNKEVARRITEIQLVAAAAAAAEKKLAQEKLSRRHSTSSDFGQHYPSTSTSQAVSDLTSRMYKPLSTEVNQHMASSTHLADIDTTNVLRLSPQSTSASSQILTPTSTKQASHRASSSRERYLESTYDSDQHLVSTSAMSLTTNTHSTSLPGDNAQYVTGNPTSHHPLLHKSRQVDNTHETRSNVGQELQQHLDNQEYEFTTNEGLKVVIKRGDITKERADVIANAANEYLEHGGGVAGAILKAGGMSIQIESRDIVRRWRPLKVSEVATTASGILPCKHIIHAFGPTWTTHGKKSVELLTNTIFSVLVEAKELKARSISIPAISSGLHGMPKEKCAHAMYKALMQFSLTSSPHTNIYPREIRFVNIERDTVRAFIVEFFTQNMTRAYGKQTPTGWSHNYSATSQASRDHLGTSTSSSYVRGLQTSTIPTDTTQYNLTRYQTSVSPSQTTFTGKSKSTYASPIPSASSDVMSKIISISQHHGYGDCNICANDDVLLRKLNCCDYLICDTCSCTHFTSNSKCPACQKVVLLVKGNQPDGDMRHRIDRYISLPGYESYGTITITYYFPDGKQESGHQNPGQRYVGTSRTAYLPDTMDGREILALLDRAFKLGLLFTIGTSHTTGQTDCVVWNDVHHKTSVHGGPTKYGYPDPSYLKRVRDELAAKGVK